jgi:ABC-type Zn uptake system ZnuABC Zn-binding protein ZnuA
MLSAMLAGGRTSRLAPVPLPLLPVLLAVFLALSAACTGASTSSRSNRLPVVTTVTQVSALVRAVGGGRVELTALLTPRDDPHQYELKPDQVATLSRAAVVFESGAGADKWMDRGLSAAGAQGRLVDLSRSVRLRQSGGAGEGGADPHWWYDVDDAAQATDAIASALARADPAGAAAYRDNADALKQRLNAADRDIRALLDPVPPSRRLFVANHDAFNYFLARYGITLVGDVVPSTDSIQAVRPADVARLVAAIRERHVCAIFTETTMDPKLVGQVAAEAGVRVYDGRLYGDALGEPGTPEGTLEGALLKDGQLMAQAFTSC